MINELILKNSPNSWLRNGFKKQCFMILFAVLYTPDRGNRDEKAGGREPRHEKFRAPHPGGSAPRSGAYPLR